MEATGYFKTYFEAVMHEMSSNIIPQEGTKAYDELKDAVWNSVFDKEGPRTTSTNAPDKTYFIAGKLFRPLSEIVNNIEALENIAIYAGCFPHKRHGVSRVSYLRYHIENYLNELYILKNRLIAYLKLIERAYRKSDNIQQIKKALKPIYSLVSDSLEGRIKIRGSHVHDSRYSDRELDRLVELELLTKGQDDRFTDIMHSLYNEHYKDFRKKWVCKIKSDMRQIDKLIDFYFETLSGCIIENNKIIYPSNTTWA